MKMQDYQDMDTPLQYKFGMFLGVSDDDRDMVLLSDWSNENFISTVLPQGELTVIGFVSDCYGAITRSELKVTITNGRRVLLIEEMN